jgi:hypothetical protein
MRARYSALALLCTEVQPGSMPHLRADAAVLFHALRRSARVPLGGTWISGPPTGRGARPGGTAIGGNHVRGVKVA